MFIQSVSTESRREGGGAEQKFKSSSLVRCRNFDWFIFCLKENFRQTNQILSTVLTKGSSLNLCLSSSSVQTSLFPVEKRKLKIYFKFSCLDWSFLVYYLPFYIHNTKPKLKATTVLENDWCSISPVGKYLLKISQITIKIKFIRTFLWPYFALLTLNMYLPNFFE